MKIGILTGGGDCPGMNAFLRAVTRSAFAYVDDVEVWGVLDGWRGLIDRSYRRLAALDTAGISTLGGTILGTIRVPELRENDDLRQLVHRNLLSDGFDALFVCGGNGSLHASHDLDRRLRDSGREGMIYFTAASIDNDVANAYTTSLGFYSAINRSVEMMNWIRDTASAHRRVYVINSMGRRSAWLPFYAGLSSGVEYVIRPNEKVDFEAIADMIEKRDRDTRIIVSEAYPKSLEEIKAILDDALERRSSRHDIRTVDMGYFQRGGEAAVTDVLRANWLGFKMVRALAGNIPGGFFGAFSIAAEPTRLTFDEAIAPEANHDDIPREMIEMAIALR